MEEHRRMIRLTNEETKLLVNLIIRRQEVLDCKKTDAVSNARKARSWSEVEAEFNSQEFVRKRTVKQLRKSWENVKIKKRKQLAMERQERMRTGGGPMPSTSAAMDLPPEVEIALPSVSYSPPNAGDCDMLAIPSITPVGREGTPEFPLEIFEESEMEGNHPREANTPGVPAAEVPSKKRRAPLTREAAIEKEMDGRLQYMASSHEKEEEIQKLRRKEVEIAIAIKEQELANAKASERVILLEEGFKRRILEVQFKTEEVKLQRLVFLI